MRIISLIAAVDEANCIGGDGGLLWHIPEDMVWFKKHTKFKVVVMGRKTYDSLPSRLKDRHNVVITSGHIDGVECVKTLDEGLFKYDGEIMVIGGGSVYKQALPFADRLYLTRVDGHHDVDVEYPVYFPEIDFSQWYRIYTEPHYGYEFQIWCKKRRLNYE